MINHLITHFCVRGKGTYISSWVFRILPGRVLWSIWKAHNKAVFYDHPMCPYKIMEEVKLLISYLYSAHKLKLKRGNTHNDSIHYFNLLVEDIDHYLQVIRWVRPFILWIKLNVDGTSKGNPGESGSGGIFRDSNFDFILAFANYLGHQTSMFAKPSLFTLGCNKRYKGI